MELKEYIDKGISFDEYKNDIQKVIDKGEGGNLAEYYPLNLQRMQRLEKKLSLTESQIEEIKKIDKDITFLIITEGWCGDASQILPVVEKMVEQGSNLKEKIVYRDENQDLMNQYLTNGGQSIPIIVAVDKDNKPLFHWGPRPQFGMEILKDYKSGKLTKDEFAIALQKAYNQDKGESIANELIEKIKNV